MEASPTAPPRPPSLRRQFARAVVLAALLPAAALGVVEQVNHYRTEQRHLGDRLEVATLLSAASVNEFVEAHLAGVALVASMSGDDADWPARLAELDQRYPAFISVLATDADGTVRAMQPQPPADAPSHGVGDRDYFRIPQATGLPYVSNAFQGRRLGTDPLVAVAAPLRTRDGAFAGVVEGSIRVDAFTALRAGALRRRGAEMLILDRDLRVIQASEGLHYRFLESLKDAPFLVEPGEKAHEIIARRLDAAMADGRDAWVAQTTLTTGWTLVMMAPDDRLMATVRERAFGTLGLLALIGAGVWFAHAWQMRRFDGALAQLSDALQALAVQRRPSASTLPEEFEPLGRAVVELADQLEDAHHDLERSLADQSALSLSLQRTLARREQEIDARTAELRLANAELDRLNRIDPLTGCLNRRGLQHRLAMLSDEAGQLLAPMAAIVLDVDHFKTFNDRYGHAAGDSALRRVAGVVAGVLQPQDAAARMGGEEFLVVLPQPEAGTAARVAERIRAGVHALGIPHADSPWGVVTVSLGCVQADAGDDHAQAFLLADEALYRAKHAGRNRVEED